MATSREELKMAVHEIMNDVIEQGFHHLVSHPQQGDELNRIIKDASDELSYLLLKVDSHNYKPETPEIHNHYNGISMDAQRRSLELLSKLQKLQHMENPRLRRV